MREKITIKKNSNSKSGYGVYDTKDNYLLVGVFDSIKDISIYFGLTKGSILSMISRKQKLKNRYIVEKVEL